VPAGFHAHRILVRRATDAGELGLFVIDPASPGVTRERQITTNRDLLARMSLTSARAEVLVAPSSDGKGREALEWLVQHATVACARWSSVSPSAPCA